MGMSRIIIFKRMNTDKIISVETDPSKMGSEVIMDDNVRYWVAEDAQNICISIKMAQAFHEA